MKTVLDSFWIWRHHAGAQADCGLEAPDFLRQWLEIHEDECLE